MSSQELDALEKDEFLKWRRSLAALEQTDGIVLTPFERNLEFWRQLWRVVERSDLLIQLVDARQPLLYFCQDLEQYVKEVDQNKISIVLINKSDYLTKEQRKVWADYFNSRNIRVIFWSALLASQVEGTNDTADQNLSENQTTIEQKDQIQEGNSIEADQSTSSIMDSDSDTLTESDTEEENDSNTDEDGDADSSEEYIDAPNQNDVVCEHQSNTIASESVQIPQYSSSCDEQSSDSANVSPTQVCNSPNLVGVDELLELITETLYPPSRKRLNPERLTVGFVGYPNVGKSSTLNAIMGSKKTGVSATPGKTKHFQTFLIPPDLMLCDCPGLVMPSFAYSKADLVVAGILSIDEMRDCLSPIGLICEQISRNVLETMYGIHIKKTDPSGDSAEDARPTPHELLAAHAFMHGFMTAKGNPNYDRSARIILKDYVQGRLVFCHPPPGVDPVTFQNLGREATGLPAGVGYLPESKLQRFRKTPKVPKENSQEIKSNQDLNCVVTDFDRMVFAKNRLANQHVRSLKQVPRIAPMDDRSVMDDETASISSTSSWATVDTVGGSSLLSGVSSNSAMILDGNVKKPWRIMSHSKKLNSVHTLEFDQMGNPVRGHQTKKRKEKLRRVYGYLDQHEKT